MQTKIKHVNNTIYYILHTMIQFTPTPLFKPREFHSSLNLHFESKGKEEKEKVVVVEEKEITKNTRDYYTDKFDLFPLTTTQTIKHILKLLLLIT